MRLSIVIPVYNEEETIPQVIEQVLAVSLDGVEKEIVVVNDGSSDKTGEVVQNLSTRMPGQLTVVHHEENQGKGAAIRTAMAHVTGDLVVTQDADLEYDPQDYPALVAPFSDPAVQVVYGSATRYSAPTYCAV
jgi:dolichol-phosphate mannosyltransferase